MYTSHENHILVDRRVRVHELEDVRMIQMSKYEQLAQGTLGLEVVASERNDLESRISIVKCPSSSKHGAVRTASEWRA